MSPWLIIIQAAIYVASSVVLDRLWRRRYDRLVDAGSKALTERDAYKKALEDEGWSLHGTWDESVKPRIFTVHLIASESETVQ